MNTEGDIVSTKTGLSKTVIYKYCKNCGKKYLVADRPTSAYCSTKCRKAAFKNKDAKAILNRPYTSDTKFLINKWHSEGMDITDICSVLNRSRKNVEQALKGAENNA